MDDREAVPLTLQHIPLGITMAILNQGQSIVIDPTLLEENIAEGSLTIVMNHLGEICALTKTGGVLLDAVTLLKCVQLAKTKIEELRTFVQDTCVKTEKGKEQDDLHFQSCHHHSYQH